MVTVVGRVGSGYVKVTHDQLLILSNRLNDCVYKINTRFSWNQVGLASGPKRQTASLTSLSHVLREEPERMAFGH